MAGWIFAISSGQEEHWQEAVEHGLWDTVHRRDFKVGENVYFWKSGHQRFAGWGRISGQPITIDESTPPGPWSDDDDRDYKVRFHFNTIDDESSEQRWKEIQKATGIGGGLNTGPVRVADSAAEAYLQRMFGRTSPDQIDLAATPAYPSHPDEDLRTSTLRAIKTRQGQGKFRESLIRAYEGRCAVTGTDVPDALEAAHIDQYRGPQTQFVENGLLLRADIHTLFDLHLLTIDAEHRVALAPGLSETSYDVLDGSRISLPQNAEEHPSNDALERHRIRCPWYTTA